MVITGNEYGKQGALLILISIVYTHAKANCEMKGMVLTCDVLPKEIPDTVQHVYIEEQHLENDILEFDSIIWRNVTLLDILSEKGHTFRNRYTPIFENLTSLRILGIHAKELGELDQETFENLSKLETLDLSNCVDLNIKWVTNILVLNTSLENLKNLIISSIYASEPIVLDKYLLELIYRRQLKSLNVSGMAIAKISLDLEIVSNLCQSLTEINMSNTFYTGSGADIFLYDQVFNTDEFQCKSLQTVDISGLYIMTLSRVWALIHVSEIELVIDMNFDLKWFPNVEKLYADRLNFRVAVKPFTMIVQRKCLNFSSSNLYNLKRLYFRENHLKWMNASCIGCRSMTLTLIDFSSNELEYLSPAFVRDWVSLEEITLSNNKLYVMEKYSEFGDLFKTFIKLRKLSLNLNHITFLPKYIFFNNVNLEYLDLSSNYLTTLSFSLKNQNKLKYLDLRHNQISVLNGEDFLHFVNFIQGRFENENITFSLHLDDNPFSCTCEGYRLVYWIYVYLKPQSGNNQKVTCLIDGKLTEIDHIAVYESHNQCNRRTSVAITILTSGCILITASSTAMLFIIYIRRRRRQKIREGFVKIFKNDRILYKHFLHIIYCSKDADLFQDEVKPMLLETLQELMGFKDESILSSGYMEYRLGRYVACETEECIRRSCSVLFLLSNNSYKCTRCQSELQMADSKKKTIAVLRNECFDSNNIPPLLSTYMTSSLNASFAANNFKIKPCSKTFCKSILDKTAAIINE